MSETTYSNKKKWTSPGSLIFTGVKKVENQKISLFRYNKDSFFNKEVKSAKELPDLIKEGMVNWINVTGLHEVDKLAEIAKVFNIHPLVFEDILNINHTPKYENYGDYLFVIAKMIDLNKNSTINIEQVSFILGGNYIITFQEDEEDVFNIIRDRIKNNIGRIRQLGADYLLYRLIDSIVDAYYVILENLEEKIDDLDDLLMDQKEDGSLQPVYTFRKELLKLRRAVFPLRETIHGLERERGSFITKNTYLFLRDLSDHLKYIYDSIENYREIVTGMIEVYMSSESHRLNEVIKVLTIISTIFIPLTFIVGIYGMNFNTASKWNMPELNWIYGYPFVWIVMLLISAGMIIFFKRKKWF
jgi:magnesium transporter